MKYKLNIPAGWTATPHSAGNNYYQWTTGGTSFPIIGPHNYTSGNRANATVSFTTYGGFDGTLKVALGIDTTLVKIVMGGGLGWDDVDKYPFLVLIGEEKMMVLGSPFINILEVQRGASNTKPTNHHAGSLVVVLKESVAFRDVMKHQIHEAIYEEEK